MNSPPSRPVTEPVNAARDYEPVINVLIENNLSIVRLITVVLTEKSFKNHPLAKDLLENSETILIHLLGHSRLPESTQNRACALVERIYARELRVLVLQSNGWHFSALRAAPRDIEDFGLDEMSLEYMKTAPRIWSLLDALLSARAQRKTSLILESNRFTDEESHTRECSIAEDRDEQRLEGGSHTSHEGERARDSNRKNALSQIVSAQHWFMHARVERFMILEKNGNPQYVDARCKSESECLCNNFWNIFAFLQYTATSDKRSPAYGSLCRSDDNPLCYQFPFCKYE